MATRGRAAAGGSGGDGSGGGRLSGKGAADALIPSSYEQARDELTRVVAALEEGGLTLDQSLALWERGQALAGACERFLAGARARVDAALAESDVSDESDESDESDGDTQDD